MQYGTLEYTLYYIKCSSEQILSGYIITLPSITEVPQKNVFAFDVLKNKVKAMYSMEWEELVIYYKVISNTATCYLGGGSRKVLKLCSYTLGPFLMWLDICNGWFLPTHKKIYRRAAVTITTLNTLLLLFFICIWYMLLYLEGIVVNNRMHNLPVNAT